MGVHNFGTPHQKIKIVVGDPSNHYKKNNDKSSIIIIMQNQISSIPAMV